MLQINQTEQLRLKLTPKFDPHPILSSELKGSSSWTSHWLECAGPQDLRLDFKTI